MNKLNNKQKIFIILSIILIIISIYFIHKNEQKIKENEIIKTNLEESDEKNKIEDENNSEHLVEEKIENNKDEKMENKITIYVSGEVNKPGVYELNEGSRIKDAIDIASGINNNANIEDINLALKLEDGMKIDIPNKNEEKIEENTTGKSDEKNIKKENKKIKININKATQEELESVTGIGPSTATKIIKYRKENGRFKTIEDIKNVTGIGDNKFNSMKDEIEV